MSDHIKSTYTINGTTYRNLEAQVQYDKERIDALEVAPDAVTSVNGQTGAVHLDAGDVGALPIDTPIPTLLPNPFALNFTGSNPTTYDGSAPVTVAIPDATQTYVRPTPPVSVDPGALWYDTSESSVYPTLQHLPQIVLTEPSDTIGITDDTFADGVDYICLKVTVPAVSGTVPWITFYTLGNGYILGQVIVENMGRLGGTTTVYGHTFPAFSQYFSFVNNNTTRTVTTKSYSTTPGSNPNARFMQKSYFDTQGQSGFKFPAGTTCDVYYIEHSSTVPKTLKIWDGTNWVPISGYGGGSGGTYTLPVASSSALGGVKADAAQASDTVPARIAADGKLYVTPPTVTIPAATSSILGGVYADARLPGDTQPVRVGLDGKLYVPPVPSAAGVYTGTISIPFDQDDVLEILPAVPKLLYLAVTKDEFDESDRWIHISGTLFTDGALELIDPDNHYALYVELEDNELSISGYSGWSSEYGAIHYVVIS